jgi:hypothetical protein
MCSGCDFPGSVSAAERCDYLVQCRADAFAFPQLALAVDYIRKIAEHCPVDRFRVKAHKTCMGPERVPNEVDVLKRVREFASKEIELQITIANTGGGVDIFPREDPPPFCAYIG